MRLILTPAYGADYKSKAAILDALMNNKDFRVEPTGGYISLPELAKQHITDINVRYGKLRKVTTFSVAAVLKAQAKRRGEAS